MYQLAAHSRSRQPPQSFPLVSFLRGHSNFFDLVDCHGGSSPQPFDDDLRADTLLDMLFHFL